MTSLQEITHVADVLVDVEVELDRRILPISTILDLKQGSVIKLNRSAGENIDILIGGTLVGWGEIVVIESTMGVRITDFVSED